MKLWTIQARTFVDASNRDSILATWGHTPQNWRFSYRWMATQWNSRIKIAKLDAPLWCWHSCNGIHGSCPTVGTFAMLMGDWNYYASDMIVLELDVPAELALLSSYFRWNDAMDDALERRTEQINGHAFSDMFALPLLKHDTDDIQAVIPRIELNWISARWALPPGDVGGLDWDLPCSQFPKYARTK